MAESIVPKIFDPKCLDERHIVNDEEAFDTTRMLTVKEGLFMGMSSGAAMHIAIKKSSELKSGVIAVIFPDRGDDIFQPLFLHRYAENARLKQAGKDKGIGGENAGN